MASVTVLKGLLDRNEGSVHVLEHRDPSSVLHCGEPQAQAGLKAGVPEAATEPIDSLVAHPCVTVEESMAVPEAVELIAARVPRQQARTRPAPRNGPVGEQSA